MLLIVNVFSQSILKNTTLMLVFFIVNVLKMFSHLNEEGNIVTDVATYFMPDIPIFIQELINSRSTAEEVFILKGLVKRLAISLDESVNTNYLMLSFHFEKLV